MEILAWNWFRFTSQHANQIFLIHATHFFSAKHAFNMQVNSDLVVNTVPNRLPVSHHRKRYQSKQTGWFGKFTEKKTYKTPRSKKVTAPSPPSAKRTNDYSKEAQQWFKTVTPIIFHFVFFFLSSHSVQLARSVSLTNPRTRRTHIEIASRSGPGTGIR